MVTTKLTMKQKKLEEDGKLVVERNDKGEEIMPRYNCVTTHTELDAAVSPVCTSPTNTQSSR